MTVVKIYALIANPLYPEVRYIGVTRRRLDQRLNAHIRRALRGDENTHKARWIKKAIEQGCQITAVLIDEGPGADWSIWERFYIASCRSGLTNGNGGGFGTLHPTEETRQRLKGRMTPERRAAIASLRRGTRHSEETKAKMVVAHAGRPRTLAHRENLSRALKGKRKSAETRAKLSSAHSGKRLTEDHRRKIAAAGTGKIASAETRAKMSATANARYAALRAERGA